ncbi:MAG: type III-A CRISPR-associated RAMP protein Csm4, partial [Actinomycetota bacterium]|nr:type III-A CRISPR-associated RAMP protein Csm4 [Actinomycetota bacterium]
TESVRSVRKCQLDLLIVHLKLQIKHKIICLTDEINELKNSPYFLDEIPRVAIDRITSTSNIFHFLQVRFQEDCGCFFLIDLRDAKLQRKLIGALNILSDEGIGGDRSSGKGLFKPECKSFELQIKGESKFFTTLSTYFPKEDEVRKEIIKNSWYEFIERKGWVYSFGGTSFRRKGVRMFSEGSVFPDKKQAGQLVEVTPTGFLDHKVYRYGLPFKIPIEVS